jgi:hypothetical protein
MSLQTGLKVCPHCGRNYFNWCTYCQSQQEIEDVPKVMEKFGLTTDNLVAELANHINNFNSFPALNLAFNLRGLNLSKRVEFEGKINLEGRLEKMSDEEIDKRIKELLKSGMSE